MLVPDPDDVMQYIAPADERPHGTQATPADKVLPRPETAAMPRKVRLGAPLTATAGLVRFPLASVIQQYGAPAVERPQGGIDAFATIVDHFAPGLTAVGVFVPVQQYAVLSTARPH